MSDATKIVLEPVTKTRTRRWERCGACLLYLPRRPYHRPRMHTIKIDRLVLEHSAVCPTGKRLINPDKIITYTDIFGDDSH